MSEEKLFSYAPESGLVVHDTVHAEELRSCPDRLMRCIKDMIKRQYDIDDKDARVCYRLMIYEVMAKFNYIQHFPDETDRVQLMLAAEGLEYESQLDDIWTRIFGVRPPHKCTNLTTHYDVSDCDEFQFDENKGLLISISEFELKRRCRIPSFANNMHERLLSIANQQRSRHAHVMCWILMFEILTSSGALSMLLIDDPDFDMIMTSSLGNVEFKYQERATKLYNYVFS
jgi:hypothetical protein